MCPRLGALLTDLRSLTWAPSISWAIVDSLTCFLLNLYSALVPQGRVVRDNTASKTARRCSKYWVLSHSSPWTASVRSYTLNMALPRSKKRRHGGATGGSSLTKPTLSHLLNQYPIFDCFCSIVPIADLVSLTRTCRQLNSLYQRALPKQWDVNKRLKRFVQDPQGFRSQMATHNALISGSFAIQFFERVTWNESDLDIFVENKNDAAEFEQHLCEREGYRFVREQDHNGELYENMNRILNVCNARNSVHERYQ